MAGNRDQMKHLFSEIVDQLAGADQLENLRDEMRSQIAAVEKLCAETAVQIREELQKSMDEIRSSLAIDLDMLKTQFVSLKRELNEAQKASSDAAEERISGIESLVEQSNEDFEEAVTHLAEKISETMNSQKTAFETRIAGIEAKSSEIDSVVGTVRAEQGRMSSLLGVFASSFSSVASAIPAVSTPAPAVPVSAPAVPAPAVSAPVENVFSEPDPVSKSESSEFDFSTEIGSDDSDKLFEGSVNFDEATDVADIDKVYEFDLEEIEFVASESNPHLEVVVDASGQHLYKPYE